MNIGPIFWREIKIEFYNFYKFIIYFVNPILIFIFFATVFSINNSFIPYQGKMVQYTIYLLPGILTLQIYLIFNKTFSSVRIDEVSNVVRSIAISKTNLFSYYIGKLLANILLTIVRLLILSIIAYSIFGILLPLDVISISLITSAIVMGSIIWYSVGFICGIFLLKEETRDFIFSIIAFPVTFASSIYFNLDQVPLVLKSIAILNPLTYNCNIIRNGFLDLNLGLVLPDLIILFIIAFTFLLISIYSLKFLVR